MKKVAAIIIILTLIGASILPFLSINSTQEADEELAAVTESEEGVAVSEQME